MARKKTPSRGGKNSLGEVVLNALLALGYGAFEAWWNSPAKPKQSAADYDAPPTPEPAQMKTRKRNPPAWWKVLGVPKDATREQISRAYRDLMAGCHPDKVAHLSPQLKKVAEREAKKLNAAREAALQECERRN
jgi:hypothetical protein